MIAKITTGQISRTTVGPSVLSTSYYRIIHPDYESEMLSMAAREMRAPNGIDGDGNKAFKYEKVFKIANTDNEKLRKLLSKPNGKVMYDGFPVKDYDETSNEPDFLVIDADEIDIEVTERHAPPETRFDNDKQKGKAVRRKGEKDKSPTYQEVVQEIEGT